MVRLRCEMGGGREWTNDNSVIALRDVRHFKTLP